MKKNLKYRNYNEKYGAFLIHQPHKKVLVLFILFQDELVHNVHENAVISIETSKDCKLIATSSDYGHPSAAVWKVVDTPVEEILSLDVW